MASFVFFSPYILRHLNVDTLIKEKIKDELGRPVDFEYMQLQLFPAVTLNMKNFTIQDRSFFKGDELLRIGKIGLQLNIMPLFAKRVEIQKFIFKDVTLTIRQRSNKLNVKELMLDQAIHAAKKSRGKDINRSKDNKEVSVLKRDSFFDFIISELIVKNATVTYIKLDDKGDILFQESAYFLDSSFKNA